MSRYHTLFFDLDGTLTDSKLGITRSVQYALKQLGIIENDIDRLTPFAGPPLHESFATFYALSTSQIEKAIYYYRERYLSVGLFENAIYPAIPELLQALQIQGYHLFVATAKPTVQAKTILAHFQLDRYFEYIAGTTLDGARATKSAVISHIFEEFSTLDKMKVAMIGDREHDIHGAHNNGIASIAVRYGYGSHGEIMNASPTHIVQTVQELADLLQVDLSVPVTIEETYNR